jgi:uncharacterized protein YecE (DUF72 family)
MKPELRKPGRAFIGTSGWNYRHWADGVFYPADCKPPDRLKFYAGVFDAVEINNTFYHLPSPEVFANWHDSTPADFTFAVKASRFITHMKKLADPEVHMARFLTHVAELRGKLGVVLFQLPPFWKFNAGRLGGLLEVLAGQTIVPGLRAAVEVRHPSWLCDECFQILRNHHVALVFADLATCPVIAPVTADFIYVRRHGTVTVGYPASSLSEDAGRIRAWQAEGKDVHAYFNNDSEVHAVRDADKLGKLL